MRLARLLLLVPAATAVSLIIVLAQKVGLTFMVTSLGLLTVLGLLFALLLGHLSQRKANG